MNPRDLPTDYMYGLSTESDSDGRWAFLRSGFGHLGLHEPAFAIQQNGHGVDDIHVEPVRVRLESLIATSQDEVVAARRLVRKRYTRLGYRIGESDHPVFPDPVRAPFYVTIIAKAAHVTVGTVILGADSRAGLLADEANKIEVDKIRAQGGRVGELVRLALEDGVDSRAVLSSLFQSVYAAFSHIYNLTHLLIEVVPRHVPFYCRVFGFVSAGQEKTCVRVGVQSVLLQLAREDFERTLLRSATGLLRSNASSGRSDARCAAMWWSPSSTGT